MKKITVGVGWVPIKFTLVLDIKTGTKLKYKRYNYEFNNNVNADIPRSFFPNQKARNLHKILMFDLKVDIQGFYAQFSISSTLIGEVSIYVDNKCISSCVQISETPFISMSLIDKPVFLLSLDKLSLLPKEETRKNYAFIASEVPALFELEEISNYDYKGLEIKPIFNTNFTHFKII